MNDTRKITRKLTAGLAALTVALGLTVGGHAAGASTEHATWAHTAHHWPVVYVENHVSVKHWGVPAAVRAWGSGLRYGHCRAGAGCVRVYSANYGRTAWIGLTYLVRGGGQFYPLTVDLNEYYASEGAGYRHEASTHELGHTLGLGHDKSGGVMCNCDTGTLRINSYERRELAGLYGR